MRTRSLVVVTATLLLAVFVAGAGAREHPFSSADLVAMKLKPNAFEKGFGTSAGITRTFGQFSKIQIAAFRCTSTGNPSAAVDISCNTAQYGQSWNPDNEIAIAVDPENPNHLLAGSNDYFYRFNNANGTRQVLVPTGFFTSFDGGATWLDGQIPMRSGNGAGDPSPAFDAKHNVALMAQLENVGPNTGCCVTQGDVSVSRSTNGGRNWSAPITVFKGTGTGIGPANQAVFYDKEWLTVDNNPSSPHYGRAYITTSRFLNALHGAYAESPIYLSWSDNGGLTWSKPKEISGSHPSCTTQTTGPAGDTSCDEDQFSYPEVASDGTLYVHFLNAQNDAEWEVENDLDEQIMVVVSKDGGQTFEGPYQAAQLEDGFSDTPYSVIGSQTVWGHQIRWASAGNISVNPNNPLDVTVVWSDRGTANPNATDACIDAIPGDPPNYDPCNSGPSANTNVYYSRSLDGGKTWTGRTLYDGAAGHQWFPWADHKSDGTLAVAWDEDLQSAGGADPVNEDFAHVLRTTAGKVQLGLAEHVDISVTHWAGQYVPESLWPRVCGPNGYSDPPVTNAEGKDCNQFHGDYTGLAVDSLDRVHVVWTGLNRFATSPQIDFYTGAPHDGYVQDAMYARRG
jgi:hypothetical protein